MKYLILWGNVYVQIISNGRGNVITLYPLMLNKMTVDRDENSQIFYQYNRSNDESPTMSGSFVTLRSNDVLHILGLGFDGLVAYSPIAIAKTLLVWQYWERQQYTMTTE